MKTYAYLALALLTTGLASCEEEQVGFYASGQDGIYFNYENEKEFEQSVNFADYITADSAFLSVWVKLKTVGYLSDQDRKVTLKQEQMEAYRQADIEIPEIVVPAGAAEVNVRVKVLRPKLQDIKYAVKLSIDGSNGLADGIKEKASFTIYAEETYEQPGVWNSDPKTYFGEWNVAKHRFLG